MTTGRSPESGGQSGAHKKRHRERRLSALLSAPGSRRRNGQSPAWKGLSRQSQVAKGNGFPGRCSYSDALTVEQFSDLKRHLFYRSRVIEHSATDSDGTCTQHRIQAGPWTSPRSSCVCSAVSEQMAASKLDKRRRRPIAGVKASYTAGFL